MRTLYLLIILAALAGCKTETTSETAILGITVPANMSGIPSSN
jgi:hypothetical protein